MFFGNFLTLFALKLRYERIDLDNRLIINESFIKRLVTKSSFLRFLRTWKILWQFRQVRWSGRKFLRRLDLSTKDIIWCMAPDEKHDLSLDGIIMTLFVAERNVTPLIMHFYMSSLSGNVTRLLFRLFVKNVSTTVVFLPLNHLSFRVG